MKLRAAFVALIVVVGGVVYSPSLSAKENQANTFGLKVAPLQYKATLQAGENKKGFVDVSNPTNEVLEVTSSVQAFRQSDNSGTLEFFDNEQVEAGVQLDLESFELPPQSALRMYFVLNSSRLPSGDVFASIFFTTRKASSDVFAINSAVRVGTLLSIVNGTPGSRIAEVTQLSAAPVQWGEIKGKYSIKNTARPDSVTGFYPKVNLALSPFGEQKTSNATLLFAGRERQNEFTLSSGFGGIYQLTANYGKSQKHILVMSVTPWLIAAIVMFTVGCVGIALLLRRRSQRIQRTRRARKR